MRVAIVALLIGCSDGATANIEDESTADSTTVDDASDSAMTSETVAETNDSTVADTTSVDTMTVDTTSDATKPCTDTGAKVFAGHCYFPTSPSSWSDARAACEKAAAHLVTVTSDPEHLFVTSFGGITDRWIGLSRMSGDPILKESYKWITGEASTYDKWSLTEPNGTGTCGEMTPSGLWADADCSKLFPGLCERD
jgi:hypothetical protein